MRKTKKALFLAIILILALGTTTLVHAASQNIYIDMPSNQAVSYKSFYCSGGSTVKFTFKAANNPNCHYYCTITSGSLYGDPIVTTGQVLGNGSDSSTVTARNMSSGYYFAAVRPINGSTNGKTVNCTLTVTN